jgi:PPE-repeat proteins
MRKEKYIFSLFLAGAFAVAATSCIKDNFIDRKTENVVPKDDAPGLHSFKISAGHEDSENGNASSRAYLDISTYQYYWSPGDQVGMTITQQGSPASTIAHNISMASDNTANAEHVNFSGKLTPGQLNALSSSSTYDYYSYFPHNPSLVGTFPIVQFSIPSSLSLTPNVFNPNYAPMVAVQTNKPPIIYLDGQTLTHSNLIHFDYNHIMSYAAIEMDVSLLNQRQISSITMSVDGGVLISGNYNYNMSSGSAGYVAGSSSSITINITGELTVGSGNVLYVPIPPINLIGRTFTFSFQVSGTNKYENVTVPGINFTRGKIHKLRVAPVVKYTANETFTTTKAGYYYIEAWGGDGGNGGGDVAMGLYSGSNGGNGGSGLRQAGLYYFDEGDMLNVQIGEAGKAGIISTPGTGGSAGGAGAGLWFGNGHIGGKGGNGSSSLWSGGGGGGGGGAASGVRRQPKNTSGFSIILVSGGGGGGSGGGGDQNGLAGGNSGIQGIGTTNSGNYARGGNGWSTGDTNGITFGSGSIDGRDGNTWALAYRGGGGAGGGGGGWNGASGGGARSGTGGDRGGSTAGGSGAGGQSSSGSTTVSLPGGYTSPTQTLNRPGGRRDGYVIITYIRPNP